MALTWINKWYNPLLWELIMRVQIHKLESELTSAKGLNIRCCVKMMDYLLVNYLKNHRYKKHANIPIKALKCTRTNLMFSLFFAGTLSIHWKRW